MVANHLAENLALSLPVESSKPMASYFGTLAPTSHAAQKRDQEKLSS